MAIQIQNVPQAASTTGSFVLGVISGVGKLMPLNTLLASFTPTGTGGVNRTFKSKVEEIERSVIDYGADSTGVADSTTAFNNAIAATRRLHIPAGTYRVTNISITKSINIYGDGRYSSRINITTTNQHGWDMFGTDAESAEGMLMLKDLSLNYTGAGQAAGFHGLVIRRRSIIDNVMVQDFTNNGVSFERRDAGDPATAAFFCHLTRVFSRNNGNDGIYVHDGANANLFLNCDFSNNGRYGWHQDSGYGNLVIGGQASYNTSYGYHHAGGTNAMWLWPYAEGNGRSGGVGYVNTPYDFFISDNSDRCFMQIGVLLNNSLTHVRAPGRSVESCSVIANGRRIFGSTDFALTSAGTAVANLAAGATLATVVTKVNELLASLRLGDAIQT